MPLLVGGLCLLALDPAERPRTTPAKLTAVIQGYPITIGFSLTLRCYWPSSRY